MLMKRWYNHLTIYSIFWTVSLALYTLKFIEYYEISSEAWFYIGLSWFMLFLGSVAVIFAWSLRPSADSSEIHEKQKSYFSINLRFLSGVIIVLSILSSITIVYQFILVTRFFGSLGAAIIQGNLLYGMRVTGEFGGIPYLGSFPLAACCLAGIYTALRRKVTFLSVLPFFLVGLHGVIVMGRWNILVAAYLFLTAFLYTPHKRFVKRRTIVVFIMIAVLALGSVIFISSTRKLKIHFRYENQEMEGVRSLILFLPSIYFYLSSPPVAFSEYLYIGEEEFYPGSYTFKPMYNILAKFDLVDPLPMFNPFICTPEPINAGTYLREIHADFGSLGVMLFPYVLGIFLTILFLMIRRRPTTTLIVIMTHFYAVVCQSWNVNAMKLGQWAVSILVCVVIALKLDSMARKGRSAEKSTSTDT
jgi:oligosaccharide repeat unit polymerase